MCQQVEQQNLNRIVIFTRVATSTATLRRFQPVRASRRWRTCGGGGSGHCFSSIMNHLCKTSNSLVIVTRSDPLQRRIQLSLNFRQQLGRVLISRHAAASPIPTPSDHEPSSSQLSRLTESSSSASRSAAVASCSGGFASSIG